MLRSSSGVWVAAIVVGSLSTVVSCGGKVTQADESGGSEIDASAGGASGASGVGGGIAGGASGAPGTGGAAGAVDPCVGADLASDPLHCGWCGHDCQGSKCEGGLCEPVILAQKEPLGNGKGMWVLDVDEDYVYWTEYSQVNAPLLRIPKGGGEAAILLEKAPSVTGIASFGDKLYLTHGQQDYLLSTCSKTTGETVVLEAGGPEEAAFSPVVNGESALWFAYGPPPENPVFTLHRYAFPGGPGVPLVQADSLTLFGCMADAQHLYWVDNSNSSTWRLKRIPKTGGVPEVLAVGEILGQALNDTDVYYLDKAKGKPNRLMRLPKSGGAAVEVPIEGDQDLEEELWLYLLIDHSSAYWISAIGQKTRTLMRAPLQGGKASKLSENAPGSVRVSTIVQDAHAIYFARHPGELVRVPK